jgi:sugar O-acyltransferase (sialic acid O-acetyltransferase NeuD family)
MNERSMLYLFGTGGLAREVAGYLLASGYALAGFVAENDGGPKTVYPGVPVAGSDAWFMQHADYVAGMTGWALSAVIAVGSPAARSAIFERFRGLSVEFPNVIHPHAFAFPGETAAWGQGNLVAPGAVISTGVDLGDACYVNFNVAIGHDCALGDGCVINLGANLAGGVVVGRRVLVGAGAVILEGRKVGDDALIGAGAVITHDVPPGETWVGVPARRLER